VLNSGSVGTPFNGDPGAQYLVMTAPDGQWEAEFRSVPYDHTPGYEAWARSGDLERSMAAHVFMYEVETATYHLGSYLRFCEARALEPNTRASFEQYRHAARYTAPGRSLHGAADES